MVDGTPKRAIQMWTKTLVMLGTVMSVIGVASGQWVKWSTMKCLFEGGRGLTRSTWSLSKRIPVLENLPSSATV